MNKQQLADLFSEQVDHLLHGESTDIPANTEDLQELLDFIGQSTMQNQFQAGPVAQATFQSQLAGWFGLGNGGAPMTILGLSKTWFISIVIVIITLVTGTGIISIIATSIFVYNVSGLPLTPTTEPTAEPTGEPTGEPTAEPTGEPTVEPTGEPTIEPTSEPTTEPGTPPVELPTLIFLTNLASAQLCQGAYTTQETLVNYGNQPVTDAALAWNVIEGGTFVNDVNISSPGVPETSGETGDATPVSAGDSFVLDEEIVQSGYVNFNPVSVEQDVNLDVKVKVNDAWWEQPDGTEIKVKLSVTNRVVYSNNDDYEYSDYNRGHGNDPDGFDEDNPGRSRRHHSDSSTSQIITIVKQSAQWVIVTGPAYSYDDQSFLVDGTIVTIDVCSEAPPTLPPGANVQVIGLLQPDGTLVVISMSIISINNSNNIITGDFKSGVPMPGKDNDSGGDSDNDGGGGGGGGHDGDHNRGHGNDDDGHDEDNPGHGGR